MSTMLPSRCCCCGLRYGALAVCVVYLTLSLLEVLIVLCGWGAADATGAAAYRWAMEYRRRHPEEDYSWYTDRVPGLVALVPLTFVAVIQLLFDLVLARGMHIAPSRPPAARRHLLAWLAFRAVLFGIISVGNLALLISAIVLRYDFGNGSEILSVITGISFVFTTIVCGAAWYSWTVVLSFYWHLHPTESAAVTYTYSGGLLQSSAGTSQPTPAGDDFSGRGQKWT